MASWSNPLKSGSLSTEIGRTPHRSQRRRNLNIIIIISSSSSSSSSIIIIIIIYIYIMYIYIYTHIHMNIDIELVAHFASLLAGRLTTPSRRKKAAALARGTIVQCSIVKYS